MTQTLSDMEIVLETSIRKQIQIKLETPQNNVNKHHRVFAEIIADITRS
jgi:hypothetical protein